jgi:hypothetical protein
MTLGWRTEEAWSPSGPGDWGVIAIDVPDSKAQCFAGSLVGQVVQNLPFDQSCLFGFCLARALESSVSNLDFARVKL